MLTEQNIKTIKATIEKTLLQRGFDVNFTSFEFDNKGFNIESEKFQTFPVIFKEITIGNFGGSIGDINEFENKIYIPIHAFYKHFSGGSNGCELFIYTCKLSKVNNTIFDEAII